MNLAFWNTVCFFGDYRPYFGLDLRDQKEFHFTSRPSFQDQGRSITAIPEVVPEAKCHTQIFPASLQGQRSL